MLLLGASVAWAGMGQPSPGEMGFQGAASPVAEEIHRFYDFVNIIIVAITVFVMLLMLYVMYTVLINSAIELIPPLRGLLRASLGEAVVRSLLSVAIVVVIVRHMSRKRIFWRA